MASLHIKQGEEVVVISGSHRGLRGTVQEFLKDGTRVRVAGVGGEKRAVRKSPQHPEGGIIDRPASIHVSNIMSASQYDARRKKVNAAAQ